VLVRYDTNFGDCEAGATSGCPEVIINYTPPKNVPIGSNIVGQPGGPVYTGPPFVKPLPPKPAPPLPEVVVTGTRPKPKPRVAAVIPAVFVGSALPSPIPRVPRRAPRRKAPPKKAPRPRRPPKKLPTPRKTVRPVPKGLPGVLGRLAAGLVTFADLALGLLIPGELSDNPPGFDPTQFPYALPPLPTPSSGGLPELYLSDVYPSAIPRADETPELVVLGKPTPLPGPLPTPGPLGQPDIPTPYAPPLTGPEPTPRPEPSPRPQPRPLPEPYPKPEPLGNPLPFAPFAPPKPFPPSKQVPLPKPTPAPDAPPREALDLNPKRCQCPKQEKKEKKERKEREVCYSGTYRELKKGLSKHRRKEIPCQ
jgi:hypothetical protein